MKSRSTATATAYRCALAALGALALAGCGEIKNTIVPPPGTANQVTVALAGRPNAFDVGLYEAQALGYFSQSDLDVHVVVPTAGEDPVTLLHDRRVLIAFSSEPNVLLHRNRIQPVVSIAAIVHAPLPQISIPAPPAGPSGGAPLTTTTSTTPGTRTGAGRTGTTRTGTSRKRTTRSRHRPATRTATTTTATGTPRTTTTTATTATTTPSGASATSTSATTTGGSRTSTVAQPDRALWPAALQQLLSRPGPPTYDGLVVVVRKNTIVDRAGLLRRFVQALARGYRAARANPRQAISNLVAAVPSLAAQRALELSTLNAAIPYFFPPGLKVWGYERQAQWNAFGTWLAQHELISDPNAITDASTNELLQGQGI